MSELENESQKGEEESTSVTDLVAATYQEYLLQSKKKCLEGLWPSLYSGS